MAQVITLDQEVCIGCQNCMEICPEVFGFEDDSEKAFVLADAQLDAECAEEAAASCPVSCITVE